MSAPNPVVITFTGGLGAQVYSAAAYFGLELAGVPVVADFSYFERQAPAVAAPGQRGAVSIWGWDLDGYGLSQRHFSRLAGPPGPVVRDGVDKLRLAEAGFSIPEVRERFPLPAAAREFADHESRGGRFACLHVRRGDYLNVASYLVPDEAYERLLRRVARLVPRLVVVSDTSLDPRLDAALSTLPIEVTRRQGGAPHLIHGLMRLSTILICSNSQFSVSAGLLRDDDALTFLPSRHVGNPADPIDLHLRDLAEFQVLTRRSV